MTQLDGSVSVDSGYRVVEAGDSSSRRSRVEQRAGHSSAGAWDEDLGRWGSERWVLPGQGDRGAGCGEFYPEAVCDACGSVHYGSHICGKRSCPDCWSSWAHDAAVRATERVQAFRYTQPDDYHRQVAHAYVSPPEGAIMNEREFFEGRKKAAEIAKEKGWRGFAVIPHPFRLTEAAKAMYDMADVEYGIWVWWRRDRGFDSDLIYWSPHYHIVGATSADMDEADSEGWVYQFKDSLPRFDGIRDRDSHESVYGVFRYLLSHTGFPEGSTKQATVWYGGLGNNVFVEEATESWQTEKPPEHIRDSLRSEIEEVVGPTAEDDEEADSAADVDDKGECPNEDCDGVLIDVFDVSAYLRQCQPPEGVREIMIAARDWRLGRVLPPPGLRFPQTEEQARDAFEAVLMGR